MGKPQVDGRESGCLKNASSGWRTECRSARTEGLWPGRPPARGRPDGQAPDGWQGERLPKKRLERLAHEVPVGSDKSDHHFGYLLERLGYLFEIS